MGALNAIIANATEAKARKDGTLLAAMRQLANGFLAWQAEHDQAGLAASRKLIASALQVGDDMEVDSTPANAGVPRAVQSTTTRLGPRGRPPSVPTQFFR